MPGWLFVWSLPRIHLSVTMTHQHVIVKAFFYTFMSYYYSGGSTFPFGTWKHHFPSGISPHHDYVLGWAHITQGIQFNVIFHGHTEFSSHNNIQSIQLNYVCWGICDYDMNMHINSLAQIWPQLEHELPSTLSVWLCSLVWCHFHHHFLIGPPWSLGISLKLFLYKMSWFSCSQFQSDSFWGSMIQILCTYLGPSDKKSWIIATRQQNTGLKSDCVAAAEHITD